MSVHVYPLAGGITTLSFLPLEATVRDVYLSQNNLASDSLDSTHFVIGPEDLRHRQGWNRMEIRTALRTRRCNLHLRSRTQVQWRLEKHRHHDRHEPDDREGLKHTGTERVGLPDPLRPASQEPGILNLRWTEN